MLTDIASHVGQTLTSSVNLPARPRAKRASVSWLAIAQGFVTWLVHTVFASRRVKQLENDLKALPDNVLSDLNVNKWQFRQRSLIDQLLGRQRNLHVVNGWYN